jgi:Ferredoxin-like domain in Api92-like protein
MPNYCHCSLSFQGDKQDIAMLRTAISSKNESGKTIPIDFNQIVPMPPELRIANHSDGQLLYKRDYEKKSLVEHEQNRLKSMSPNEILEAIELAKQYHDNIQKYGFQTWYEWSWEYWGTKWNALFLDTEQSESDILEFQTAWSPPLPVLKVLSEKFPRVGIILLFRDEGEDEEDCKNIVFKNGKTFTLI